MEEGGTTAWVLTTGIAMIAALVGWVMTSTVWALVAGALLAAAGWRYFIPVDFEISHQGIFQEALGRRTRIAWRSVMAVEVRREGLLFTPGDVFLAASRGLYLPWGRHRAEVLALVSYYLRQIHPDEFVFDIEGA